jgi:hypothetical protein
MIGHTTRWATYSFSTFALLTGLVTASAARADDAAVFGCRADDQSTEVTTDCDSKTQVAKVSKPVPPPPTTPPVILFMELPGEGGKHDHDHDRNGHPEHDATGRKI